MNIIGQMFVVKSVGPVSGMMRVHLTIDLLFIHLSLVVLIFFFCRSFFATVFDLFPRVLQCHWLSEHKCCVFIVYELGVCC